MSTKSEEANSLVSLFERCVAQAPDTIAVSFREHSLTYRELNRRANQLAHHLRGKGVGPETMVGLCVERSLSMIVGILGILKAGAAYVALDPKYPAERIQFMLSDSKVPVLVTNPTVRLASHGAIVVTLDALGDSFGNENAGNLASKPAPSNLAYVIYTSGSTGKPKGVLVNHASVLHLFEATQPQLHFSERDVWTMFHSYAFDFSVWEIWGALLFGGHLVIVPREARQSPVAFYELLKRERVTVLNQTPSAMRQFQSGVNQKPLDLSLRLIVCGGEALPADLARQLLDWPIPVWNFYGPTEATVWAACTPLDQKLCASGSIPVGKPIGDTEIVLLDDDRKPVDASEPGEICIGGTCLARGYLNRPELTAKQFIEHPLRDEPGARLYKTGDLGRWRSDGNLEFLGRMDHQVKIHGFRIELGEIEVALSEHPTIQQAVVTAREDITGDKRLVAYVVPGSHGTMPSANELRGFLSQMLPDYMVPTVFVSLEKLPLTPNGKIDRQALPSPSDSQSIARNASMLPHDALERELTKIWERILHTDGISPTDDFFEIGGDSLRAAAVFAEVEKLCGRSLPLATLFRASTVEKLADLIRSNDWRPPWTPLVAIQPHGERLPFFCVHPIGGNVVQYHSLAAHFGADQPFYALQAPGLDGRESPHNRVEEMAAHYIEEIQRACPHGPYLLGGFSFGGTVAFEMARQLQRGGKHVALVALIETAACVVKPFLKRLPDHLLVLKRMDMSERFRYIFERALYRSQYGSRALASLPLPLQRVEQINREMEGKYVPRQYRGRVALFRARESVLCVDGGGWDTLVEDKFDVITVPGNHGSLLEEPHVAILARKMRALFDQVSAWTAAATTLAAAVALDLVLL